MKRVAGVEGIKPRLAVVVSSEMTIRAFLLGHLRALAKCFDVEVMANTTDLALLERHDVPADLIGVPVVRPIRPLADMAALVKLAAAFMRHRPRVVLSITPKAGLLAMLAAFIARVPVRIHIFTGQVWATRSGASRMLFRAIDRFIGCLATHVLVDGQPQRQFLIQERVLSAAKSAVLGAGSLSGVDGARFRPDDLARQAVRDELAVPQDAVLFLYVGRLNRDKGVLDLAAAFAQVTRSFRWAHLLIVGPDEAGLADALEDACSDCGNRLHRVGFSDEPERYMAAADVFCLPSYREGFPTSILEAAATGLPTIASRIYGIADAVVDGNTGLLHAPGNVGELAACLTRLAESQRLRADMGARARERALAEFAAADVTARLVAYVENCLGSVR